MAKSDLTIEISANTKKALEEIKKLKIEIKKFSDGVKRSDKTVQNSDKTLLGYANKLKSLANAFMAFQAVRGAVDTIVDFQHSISKLQAISGATAEDMAKLKAEAEKLGKTTIFSASQVSEGMNYLAMAGYKTNDILSSTKDVLNLAAVGSTSLGEAADIASNILTSFNIKAKDTNRVVDIMTATTTNANTVIPEMGEAMKMAAPEAHTLGVSLEETSAAIGTLADGGLKGTLAGAGLSTMLAKLSAPAGQAKEALKKLGITIYDSKGNFKGLQNILLQFNEKLKGMSAKAKATYLRDIFGLETLKTATTLIDKAGSDYTRLFNIIKNSSGLADKKVKVMTADLWGKLKALESALQGLTITIGEDLLPALTKITEKFTAIISSSDKFYEKHKELIKGIIELTATIYGLKKVMGIIEAVVGLEAAAEIAGTVGALAKLRTAFGLLKGAIISLGKANATLLALSIAIEGINYAFDKWEESINKTNEQTKKLQESTKEFTDIQAKLNKAQSDFNKEGNYKLTKDEIGELEKKIRSLIKTNDKSIESIKKSGDTSVEATANIKSLTLENEKLSHDLKKLSTIKPYEEVAKSAKTAKKEVDKLSQKDKEYYEKRVKEHTETIEKLKNSEKSLTDKIYQLRKDLQNRLKEIDRQRVASLEDINDKIHSLNISGYSNYDKYVDKQKQAEIALSKAKKALKDKELEDAKRYMQKYEDIVSSLANTEIKQDKEIIVSKEQSNQVAISGLEKLKGLNDTYYKEQKQKAIELEAKKEALLRTQLEATKAQMSLELQRLEIEKKLLEAQTGKKVNIDVSAAKNSIKSLDAQIKSLDEKTKESKSINIDTSEALQKIKQLDTVLTINGHTLRVTADTTPADFGIEKLISKEEGNKISIAVNPEYEKAEEKIKNAINNFEKTPVKARVTADTKEATRDVKTVKDKGKEPVTFKIRDDDREAKKSLEMLKKPISTVLTVKVDANKAFDVINQLKQNTTSVHTIYVREVTQKATGGKIFERKRGRIGGYDPSDSDDVPALLTRGEFVVKREAVAHYGDDFLYRLNNKSLPKYATGGLVDIGNPQKLIEQLSSTTDGSSDGSSSDLSDILDKLRTLLTTFKAGGNKKESDEIEKQIKLGESYQNSITNLTDSVKGKDLTNDEYDSYITKLKSYETLEDTFKTKMNDFITSLNTYLQKVTNIKDRIKSKLGDNEPDNVAQSYDLDRLTKYYEKIKTIPTKNELEFDMRRYKPVVYQDGWSTNKYFLNQFGIYSDSKLRDMFTVSLNEGYYNVGDNVYTQFVSDLLKVRKFNKGGLLDGYGGGDKNLALLEDGEFVLRKEAVKGFGVDFINNLNNLKLPKFSTGGYVGNLPKTDSSSRYDTNINFKMPTGESFKVLGSEEVANALTQYFKRVQ